MLFRCRAEFIRPIMAGRACFGMLAIIPGCLWMTDCDETQLVE